MDENPQAFAEAGMFIRKPIDECYDAFVNPEITTKFWFTKSSGRLDENTKITWTWEMYNHSVPVQVKKLEKNSLINIEWGNMGETTKVEWTFNELKDGTFVKVVNSGLYGNDDKIVKSVRESSEGFALVLAGMKAYLEHRIELGLVKDRFPPGL
jgi:uncharacterized protein YndB with AHSA1/START domain